MKLNCKPGDLALIINDMDNPENNGRFLRVVERERGTFEGYLCDWSCIAISTLVCGDGEFINTGEECGAMDMELIPIRDQDGEDETLTWAGKPQEVTA